MHTSRPDAWEAFLDAVLYRLDESSGGGGTVWAEFVLSEAKRGGEKPWEGSETWFDDKSNPKILKTKSVESFRKGGKTVEFESFILNLLPASQSGLNVCLCATADCARHCLHTAGNVGALADKTISRARKTWMLFFDPQEAFRQISSQIRKKKESIDEGNESSKTHFKQMAVRLNGTSDVIWRAVRGPYGETLFELFPDVVFYDYAKLPFEMESFMRKMDEEGKPFPKNYHMTFSYGGKWSKTHDKVLEGGHNVTVPFGPGKTASLDYMKFPKDMELLLKGERDGRPRILFPSGVGKGKDRKEYISRILDKVKEDGNFMTPAELAPFAGQALLPGLYRCHEVIDGDEYDARFLDDFLHPHMNSPSGQGAKPELEADFLDIPKKENGLVVGLTSKGSLAFSSYSKKGGWDENATGFMVGPNDPGLDYGCRLMLNNPSKAAYLKAKTDAFRKVAKAIIAIRNFDARHLEQSDRVFRTAGDKEGTLTYDSSSRRAKEEIDELIKVIQDVMSGADPHIKIGERHKRSAADTARRLVSYLQNPEVQRRISDPKFLTRAVEMGIGLNVDGLIKRIQSLPPDEPKPSILSVDTLRRFKDLLGDYWRGVKPPWRRSDGFREWLEGLERWQKY
jgi:hypothetical protein